MKREDLFGSITLTALATGFFLSQWLNSTSSGYEGLNFILFLIFGIATLIITGQEK